MFIDKQGKLFGKVSLIDIFALIIILVAIFGIYTRFFKTNEKVDVKENQIEYKMRITKVREGSFDAFSKLGPIYDNNTKEYMGEIISAEKEPYFEANEITDGTMVLSEVPEKMNVIITIKVNGHSSSAGYYTTDNKYIAAGSTFEFVTKYAKSSGEIISIKEL